jgi:HSP20 family molecular chaperone IbpA/CBS domain-containing protein
MVPSSRGPRDRGLSRRRSEGAMSRFRSEMSRLFDRWVREPFEELSGGMEAWPEVDIVEQGDDILVRAELPGIDPESVDVSIVGHELTISGEKSEEHTEEHGQVYHSERWYGSFCRTIELPEWADPERSSAEYEDGVLTIRFPKIEGASKRIPISGSSEPSRGRRLSESMTRDVECVKPDDTVKIVADRMKKLDIGSFPVCDDQRKVVGMITDRDLAIRVLAEGRDVSGTKVRDVMSGNVVTCREDETIEDAERKMKEHKIRRIPVVDAQGRLAGYFSIGKIARQASPGEQSEVLRKVTEPGGSPRK